MLTYDIKNFGKGYTEANLDTWECFYKTFQIRHTLCDKLSWSHYRLLITVKNDEAKPLFIINIFFNNFIAFYAI